MTARRAAGRAPRSPLLWVLAAVVAVAALLASVVPGTALAPPGTALARPGTAPHTAPSDHSPVIAKITLSEG